MSPEKPTCPVCGHTSRLVQEGCFASHVQCYDEYDQKARCICYDDFHYPEETA